MAAYVSTIEPMTDLFRIDGSTLEGVSATTLWPLYDRGTEAKRSDGVIRDPWAVTLFDAIMRRIRPSMTLLEFRS
jgi:O-methyltransferase involved in polyketide biosynthesis